MYHRKREEEEKEEEEKKVALGLLLGAEAHNLVLDVHHQLRCVDLGGLNQLVQLLFNIQTGGTGKKKKEEKEVRRESKGQRQEELGRRTLAGM